MKRSILIITTILLVISQTQALYGSKSKVQSLTQTNFQKDVINSKGLWLVEFYSPQCGHCKSLAPEWEKAAKALEGIVNVGAVDMTTDQQVGAPYNVQGFPTIKFFSENKNQAIDYNGGRTAKEIVDFALEQAKKVVNQRMGVKGGSGGGSKSSGSSGSSGADDKDVVVLEEGNFKELVLNSQDPWFVEFYAPWCGHCKNLAPHWNKLATELKADGIKVGKVDATVHSSLAQKYGVSGYPTIKWFNAGSKKGGPEDYSGAREADGMAEWAREKYGKPAVSQLLNQQQYDDNCVTFQGVCLVFFLPHIYDSSAKERNSYIELVERVAKSSRAKPFKFMWSEGGSQYKLEENFNVGGSGYPAVLAISNKKSVYSIMRASFSSKNIDAFVGDLLKGKSSFVKFQDQPKVNNIKEWDGKDKKPEVQDDL